MGSQVWARSRGWGSPGEKVGGQVAPETFYWIVYYSQISDSHLWQLQLPTPAVWLSFCSCCWKVPCILLGFKTTI